MNYKEYVSSQFSVSIIEEGRKKGKVCFKTPVIDYVISKDDWEILKKEIMKV